MTATLRLFTIEVRRSVALWFVLPLVVLVVWGTLSTMQPDGSPVIWARSNVQLGLMCVLVAFIMCGVGAWMAGRGRRRQTEELLATMPRPASLRDLPILAGTVVWGLLACLLGGLLVFVLVEREATWGGPEAGPVVVGLLAVVAATAIGYLGGAVIPSRFAAPLMAVVFTTAVLLLGTRSTALAYLSPLAMDPRGSNSYDVFYRAPMVPLAQTVFWLAGVTACACAATALWRRRTLLTWGVFVGACVVATTGAVLLTQAFVNPPWERSYAGQPMADYELVCVERSIPICVHPAYRARLEEYADRVGVLFEPLIGVPGGPIRAEQLPSPTWPRADGTIEILPSPIIVGHAAFVLAHDEGTDFTPAQQVIATWLLERAGENPALARVFAIPGQPDEAIAAAVRRFSALGPEAQHAWLMANFQNLRAGQIGIEDLP
jgi:hypothetical protein